MKMNFSCKIVKPISSIIILSALAGCSSSKAISPFDEKKEFQRVQIDGAIPIKGMMKNSAGSETLLVFIEGDGKSWINSSTPSLDPTPTNPIGWRIASQSSYPNILYLARPCQYLDETERKSCSQEDWTSGRYSPKLVALMDHAISDTMEKARFKRLIIGGYSGGGTMALLIAQRRHDIDEIITVASPIDIDRWSSYHSISKLSHSLNPANELVKLSTIKKRHFVGEKDAIVSPGLTREALRSEMNSPTTKVVEIEGLDHKMEGFRIPF